MTSKVLKILATLAVTALVVGCKLAVMVPSGGDVTSSSSTRNCTGGSLCEHNITDSTFNDSFTAVAKPGYVFTKWNSGSGFFCGNSTNPTCTISNVGTAGNAAIEGIIATGQFFYAMPLFAFVGIDTDGDGEKDHIDKDDDNDGLNDDLDNCPFEGPNLDGFGCHAPLVGTPITGADIVIVDGKEWAQPDLFTNNLSWDQINAACPGGTCGNVELNGYSVMGWTWASLQDVQDLFNVYIGYYVPVNSTLKELDSTWAPDFFADFNPTYSESGGYRVVVGFARYTDPNIPGSKVGLLADSLDPTICTPYVCDRVSTDLPNYYYSGIQPLAGGFFFRAQASAVLAPATLSQ
jgi:hypothetical protein